MKLLSKLTVVGRPGEANLLLHIERVNDRIHIRYQDELITNRDRGKFYRLTCVGSPQKIFSDGSFTYSRYALFLKGSYATEYQAREDQGAELTEESWQRLGKAEMKAGMHCVLSANDFKIFGAPLEPL